MSWKGVEETKPLSIDQIRQNMRTLDEELNNYWNLGKTMLLAWTPSESGILALIVPHYLLPEIAEGKQYLLYGKRELTSRQFDKVAIAFNTKGTSIALPYPDWRTPMLARAIEPVLRRYSVTRTEFRAGTLFDIVDLASLPPAQQVTLFNSLGYSITVAQARLLAAGIEVDLARVNTPSGFLVWNRQEGLKADLNLYCLMSLALVENAIARTKGDRHTAPELRTCFDVASTYDYCQPQGLSPTLATYITGDLTKRLNVMLGAAMPGQILFGHFARPNSDQPVELNVIYRMLDSARFLGFAHQRLAVLENVELAGERVSSIKAYLTGEQLEAGLFTIKQYSVSDNFGTSATVYNAKVNIHRGDAKPLFLGRQNRELDGFGFASVPFDLNVTPKDFFIRLEAW
ncbi:MAG: hypothetical protein FJX47_13435 [Alphaproteobacteria bacterium]|nr:hypothetical protein [Alphaproteobacteria bacterium]